jgi:DNA mismatch repair protein MutS2
MNRPDTIRILEFDRIRERIAGHAVCEVTQRQISRLGPLESRDEVVRRFGQVAEIRAMRRQGVSLPLYPCADIAPVLEAARPSGAVLAPLQLVLLIPALRNMRGIGRQFAYREDIPLLQELAGHVKGFPELLEPLEATVDSEGEILDSASRELASIRSRKRSLTARIRKRLEEIVREKQTAIFLQEDFITQRSGRWVIPVRMDSKGMVPGVVHDVSNSGETAFMEPLEIIGLANELENLTAEEKAEQIRILRQLTTWIREDADALLEQFCGMVALDLLNAISLLAEELDAREPVITDEPRLEVRSGRHPLLLMLQRERGGDVVPLTLTLSEQERVMVITGPNTGGKTIALKTVGILLLMARSGLPVPASGDSVFPMTTDLLADIGDEQSIDESLSTFSSHISRIARILEAADRRCLVLMDELGTGTEPGQGAAIACAVLEELRQRGAFVLATTHLTDIVGYVYKTPGMRNAAMEFDGETLSPLYRLRMGEPGQSHALEIARRCGLPQRVVERAHGLMGRMESEFHHLLDQLRDKERKAEAQLADLSVRLQKAEERERLLSSREEELETRRRETLNSSLAEAREIVRSAKREVNAIIEEARKEKSREARKQLEEAEAQLDAKLVPKEEAPLTLEEVKAGDRVLVRSLGCEATILSVDARQERLRVQAGRLEVDIPLADAGRPEKGKKTAKKEVRHAVSEAPARLELNLIGQRVDDALPELDRFLNHASLEGFGEVRIVHGKGTGALMRAVREELARHPLVVSWRKGEAYEGGEGATVVELR